MINKLVHLSRKGVKSLVTMGPEETMKKIVKYTREIFTRVDRILAGTDLRKLGIMFGRWK